MDFHSELSAYIGGNTPLLQIVSHEWERVEGALSGATEKHGREYVKWSYTAGMMIFRDGNWVEDEHLPDVLQQKFNLINQTKNPLDAIKWYIGEKNAAGYATPSVLHLEDIHRWFDQEDNEDNTRDLAGTLRYAARNHHDYERTIVLGTTRQVYLQTIEKEMQMLDLPLPGTQDLEIVLFSCAEEASIDLPTDDKGEPDVDDLINAAKGLTVMEAKVAYSKVISAHGEITDKHIPKIQEEKRQIIKKSGFLQFIIPLGKEVGGLDSLNEWITQKKKGFGHEAHEFGLENPKGILLVGFPGCGKSLTAMQTAKTWNFPLLRFDIGTVFGGIVGESESNMRDALKVADALSPCVLWIDEIEKGLAGSDSSGRTDGGTTSRVLATFLTWMQEKTEPVFVLATSNDISKMPPELTRKGRFDEIFFVDLPNKSVRGEILEIKITENPRSSVDSIDNFDIKKLVKISDGYTGAEIEAAVQRGMYAAYNRTTKRTLCHEDVEEALVDTYPMYKTMREFINELRKRKGTMYRSADSGRTDPLPRDEQHELIPRLTPQEKMRNNPFRPDGSD